MTSNSSNTMPVAVVTGASAGIGKATSKALAAMGWRVIGLGRNQARCQQALAEIRSHAPEATVDMVIADLAIMSDTQKAADSILALTNRIDALLNNAGGIGRERVVTSEGNEAIFAGNHLGHFLLTNRLLPTLRQTAKEIHPNAVRVVNVSSLATAYSPGLQWDDVQMLNDHNAGLAYCNVKIANQMFTTELAVRLRADGIRVNAMHPGVADTNFSSYGDPESQKDAAENMKDVIVSAEVAADTLIWLATDSDAGAHSGGYYHNREAVPMHAQAINTAETGKLWTVSEALIQQSLL